MLIKDVCNYLEQLAPLSYQESYDNSGLIIGDKNQVVRKALVNLDCTEEVLEEALQIGANLIVVHHPLVFKGMKRFNGNNYTERCVIKAIKHDIAVYAAHTNLDSVHYGVNAKICERLGLQNCKILSPKSNLLSKLTTFCPVKQADAVRQALFQAGAGHIGNYSHCSFNAVGTGSFMGNEQTNPFVGIAGKLHFEEEIKIETIFPNYLKAKVINALLAAHPYEEPAYDIYALDNSFNNVGSGMIGNLNEETDISNLLQHIKAVMKTECIRYTAPIKQKVKRIAVCGGSGSFLLNEAKKQGADVLVSADFKYHDFFDADGQIMIADIGHYESEQFTSDLLAEKMSEKFTTFEILLSRVKTNPVNYC